jgi:ABC-2 type transport system permease protein
MRIVAIILREWKRIFSLPVHYCVLIIMPPILFFLYASIYNNQTAKHLPLAIWDEDQSMVSRQFTFMLQQTDAISFTESINSIDQLQQLIKKGTVLGAIYFPKKMEENILSRHPVNVVVYTNAASVVPAKLIYKAAAQIIITAGSGVILEKFVKTGMNKDEAMALVQPIELLAYPLYNPDFNYQQYMVPGLITVALQMMMIMVAVLLLNYEYKTNTAEELMQLANGSASAIIVGKALAHLSIAWINFVLVVFILFPVFGIGISGASGKFFVLYNLMCLACFGIGMMISAFSKDPMFTTDIALFYTSPSFVFSGFSFPRWAMPWYDQYYGNIMPYTFFLDGFFKIYYMDLPLHYVMDDIGKLLLFIAFSFSIAILLYQKQLNQLKSAII